MLMVASEGGVALGTSIFYRLGKACHSIRVPCRDSIPQESEVSNQVYTALDKLLTLLGVAWELKFFKVRSDLKHTLYRPISCLIIPGSIGLFPLGIEGFHRLVLALPGKDCAFLW